MRSLALYLPGKTLRAGTLPGRISLESPVDTAFPSCGCVSPEYHKLYTELRTREVAATRLRGVPQLQNQTRIDKLYDLLNHASLAAIEARS